MSYAPSQDEIKQIANSFLLAAPPGEFFEVVSDVRGLLQDDSIINDTAPTTFRKWNTDQMLQVRSPNGGHEVLITQYGEVNENEYLDPKGKLVIQFDHIRQEVVGSRPIAGELDSSVEDFRSAFDEQAQEYANEHYINGGTTVYGAKKAGDHQIRICISASKFNPNSFWTGRWRSDWACTFKPGSGQIKIEGLIKINVHYYEDGNVQLSSETKKSIQVNSGDAATAASNALKAIRRIEAEFQQTLNDNYTAMSDTTFKALRRQLPINRELVQWEKLGQYKLGASTKQ
eukprot:TRINITY_DN15908_c0_g1_i1.p2 TRINITY_DN15908_c0_g1~~TRINITY_DN15908_c0_g1_i1.p2  ORF type:complete len:318 (+),score=160.46 TRINITY_DN15908_c0_g1_i1:94-954(+)